MSNQEINNNELKTKFSTSSELDSNENTQILFIDKPKKGRPKKSDISREEYLKQYHKKHYQENKEEHKIISTKNRKKYYEGFKILKKLYDEKLIPSDYVDQISDIINMKKIEEEN